MIYIFCIASGLAYVAVGAWIFGYVVARYRDEHDPSDCVPAYFAAGLWPLILPFIFGLASVVNRIYDLGIQFRYSRVKRIEEHQAKMHKIRQELAEAAAEAERCLNVDYESHFKKESHSHG